jgi:hypothetical protein
VTKPKTWRPSQALTLCRICGERVTVPCTQFLDLRRRQQPPVPNWPRYNPVELPPDAFGPHNIEPHDSRGHLPSRPESLPGTRSSMGWTREG